MRILVVGDSFCPVGVFGAAFERLRTEHEVTTFDIVDEPGWMARSPSEQKIREYLGSPAQVVERLAGHDVLVVQGAPITDAVLDAAPTLRLVCVARGGPVNVDVGAATERGIPVVITPGKNAQAVAELTLGFIIMLARRMPVHRTLPGGRRRACPGQLRGREVVRPRPGGPHPGRRRVRPDRTSRGGARRRFRDARPRVRPVRRVGPRRARRRGAGRRTRRPAGRGGRGHPPRPGDKGQPGLDRRRAARGDEAWRALHQHVPRHPRRRGRPVRRAGQRSPRRCCAGPREPPGPDAAARAGEAPPAVRSPRTSCSPRTSAVPRTRRSSTAARWPPRRSSGSSPAPRWSTSRTAPRSPATAGGAR